MNAAVVGRLMWKEWRVQRGFALVVLGGAVLVIWRVPGLLGLGPARLPEFAYSAVVSATVLYALGCGAMLFALEREQGTHAFQTSLPVHPARVAVGKLAFAALSACVMAGILAGCAAVLAGGAPGGIFEVFELAMYAGWHGAVVLVVEALAWGVLGSLWAPTVMGGFFVAAGAMFASNAVAAPALGVALAAIVPGIGSDATAQQMAHDVLALCAAGWAAVAAGSGGRAGARRRAAARKDGDNDGAGEPIGMIRTDRSGGLLRRLVWQGWRESRAVLIAATLPALLAWATSWRMYAKSFSGFASLAPFHLFALCVIPPALFGVLAFQADQRRQAFRFLTDRGARPGALWLSRQWIPGVMTLGWMVLCIAAGWWLLEHGGYWVANIPALPPGRALLAGYVAVLAITAYAAGQFCSLSVQSGLLSGVIAAAAALVLCTWGVSLLATPVATSWLVVVVPGLLLWLSYRRVAAWLEERPGWTHAAGSAACVLVTASALTAAVSAQRILSLPPVPAWAEPPAAPAVLPSDPAAPLYRKAKSLAERVDNRFDLDPPSWEASATNGEWIVVQESAAQRAVRLEVAELMQTAGEKIRRDLGTELHREYWGTWAGFTTGNFIQLLGVLTTATAVESRRAGDLDAAWRQCRALLAYAVYLAGYDRDVQAERDTTMLRRTTGLHHLELALTEMCRWAAEPGVSAVQLEAAVDETEALLAGVPGPSRAAMVRYGALVHSLSPLSVSFNDNSSDRSQYLRAAASRCMPWEMERLRRNVGHTGTAELALWRAFESGIDVSPAEWVARDHWPSPTRLTITDPLQEWLLYGHHAYHPEWGDLVFTLATERRIVSLRRAWRLAMALHRWRVEHGALPPSVDVLDPAVTRPTAVHDGLPIRYAPDGAASMPERYRWRRASTYAFPQLEDVPMPMWYRVRRGNEPGRREWKTTPYLYCPDGGIRIDLVDDPRWERMPEGG